MGTNFYARVTPSKEQKEKLKELIDLSENYDEISDTVQSMYGSLDTYTREGGKIHLGKRSAGWKFLWNPNWWVVDEGHYDTEKKEWIPNKVVKKYYDLTKQSISDFLHREDVRIFDEYGDEYTPDDFLNDVFAWDEATWDGKELWDGKAYAKWCLENNERSMYDEYGDSRESMWKELGFEPSYYDFYSDGLRFSTSVDFS